MPIPTSTNSSPDPLAPVVNDLAKVAEQLATADTKAGELVLERLPNGQYAWLRPATVQP